MHYQPMSTKDKNEMLQEIGASTFEDLVKEIPKSLRNPKIDIPAALSEWEVQSLMTELGNKNSTVRDHLSFLGGGAYDHFVPAAVSSVIGRHEFYTAYTPYQAEASQGTLQAVYEYQSLITELTGLDVSNASHYDGATSMAEAALLALRHTDRSKILVSEAVHPHYRRVLKTYLDGTPYSVEEFGIKEGYQFDREAFEALISTDVAGAIFQTPNFLGTVEDLEGVSEKLHEQGSLLILTGHPLAAGFYKSPGEWGADIAVGEGQPLGVPISFGGPYLGYFATTRALMRKIPGRLAGITEDANGKRAYVLTLQAREQHIRRERAASNICTNQALCALAACVYMTLLGKSGMREVAELNVDRANYLRQEISKLDGFEASSEPVIFNEFVVKSKVDFSELNKKLYDEGMLPGIDLSQFYTSMKDHFLVCATETKTKEDLDRFVQALKKFGA